MLVCKYVREKQDVSQSWYVVLQYIARAFLKPINFIMKCFEICICQRKNNNSDNNPNGIILGL